MKLDAAGRVAVQGTGIMGAPMARNVLKAGFQVRVWNRTLDKAVRLEPGDGRWSRMRLVANAWIVALWESLVRSQLSRAVRAGLARAQAPADGDRHR